MSQTRKIYYNGAEVGELRVTGDDWADTVGARAFLEERGYIKGQTTAAQMYQAAVGFEKVAAALFERLHKRRMADWNGHETVPFVVNTSFSLELLLKSIGEHHGKAPWGHDLLDLHRKLPVAAKNRIEAEKLALPVTRFAPQTVSKTLPQLLRPIAKAFEQWRYTWDNSEGTGVFNIDEAMFCQMLLHETATKLLYPGWTGSYTGQDRPAD